MAAVSTISTARKNSLPVSATTLDDDDDDHLLFRRQHHHRRHHHHYQDGAMINSRKNQRNSSPSVMKLLLQDPDIETFASCSCNPASCGCDDTISLSVLGPPGPDLFREEPSSSTSRCYDTALSEFRSGAQHSEGVMINDASEECTTSSAGSSCLGLSGWSKPHKGNDARWMAIRAVRSCNGDLGPRHFRALKKLGWGDIGIVYLVELSGTGCCFAMKVMNKEALASRKKLPRAKMEKEILESLDHPFLPTLYANFETERHSYLVMEYCPGGDLHNLRLRQPCKCFSEQAARFYAAEVLLALEYLHVLGIVYRDLKPENVLLRDDGHIVLSDFDLSLQCSVSPTLVKSSNSDSDKMKKSDAYCAQRYCMQPTCFSPGFLMSSRSKKNRRGAKPTRAEISNQLIPELIAEPRNARSLSFVGTYEYLAPEIIKGEGHGSPVDWWTFGIFLYELLFGKTPFKGSDNRATLFNVVGEPLVFPQIPTVSFAARDLIRRLLVKEPQHRLAYRRGAAEVKQHPFFQGMNWALIRCTSPPDVSKLYDSGGRHPAAAGKYRDIGFF